MTLSEQRKYRTSTAQQAGDRLLHREIVGWSLELRCRTDEAIDLLDAAVAARGLSIINS
jgi:hypothetical protein